MEDLSGSWIFAQARDGWSPVTCRTSRTNGSKNACSSPETIAVNTLGQLAKHPRVTALRQFVTGWYLSCLSADSTRASVEAGPQERLSPTGNNLPNVIQYLKEQHPDRLREILKALSERVPRLERVTADVMPDGWLLLQIKDAPFDQPVLARFASDGTLKLLAYLTILYDPDPPQLIGIEEPENYLHPRLLPEASRKNAGKPPSARSCSSAPIHRFSSMRFGPRRSGFFIAMKRATPRLAGRPTCKESQSSSARVRYWGIFGSKGTSRLETRWSMPADPRRPWRCEGIVELVGR